MLAGLQLRDICYIFAVKNLVFEWDDGQANVEITDYHR